MSLDDRSVVNQQRDAVRAEVGRDGLPPCGDFPQHNLSVPLGVGPGLFDG